ncbi:uncharacterized protein LOC144087183 [Stigmatopora argus]
MGNVRLSSKKIDIRAQSRPERIKLVSGGTTNSESEIEQQFNFTFTSYQQNRKENKSSICPEMSYRLLLITLLLEAARTQITGFGDTVMDYGNDAHYNCELQNQKGVQQITWQKRLRDNSVENVASYSMKFGQSINDPYQRKVILSETSLSSTSLTIKNVTWEDEYCYICIFNIFPGESKRKQTCLTLRGISEVKTKVHYSELANGSTLFVLSCSATGKPEPAIHWQFLPTIASFNQLPITTLANDDRTFTSSQNVTLHISGSWNGHAYCVAQSGNQKRHFTPVNLYRDAGWPESEETERRQFGSPLIWVCVAMVVLLAVVAAFVFVFRTPKWERKGRLRRPISFCPIPRTIDLTDHPVPGSEDC